MEMAFGIFQNAVFFESADDLESAVERCLELSRNTRDSNWEVFRRGFPPSSRWLYVGSAVCGHWLPNGEL